MDNLRAAIDVLFCRTNPEIVIQRFLDWETKDLTEIISSDRFVDLSETLGNGRNKDELRAVYDMVKGIWSEQPAAYGDYNQPVKSVFFVLLYFVNKVLLEEAESPLCEFSQLLRWRDLSFKLGEDIFATAFLANKDIESKRERHYFSWEPTLRTNNRYLRELLEKGVTDLHFHLYGSSLNFELNWLSLMNDIVGRKKVFSQLKNYRKPEPNLWHGEHQLSLYALCIKATAIRQLIFTTIVEKTNLKSDSLYYQILQASTEEELSMYTYDLQQENNRLSMSYGRRYDGRVVDYAIRTNPSPKNLDDDSFLNTILYGERWLMYKMFYYIFAGREEVVAIRPFFYAYLMIKAKLRKELIQLNNYPGFYNFLEYQDRKDLFIREGSVYERLLIKLAIKNAISKPHLKYLEARIAPKTMPDKNMNIVYDLDHIVEKEFVSKPLCRDMDMCLRYPHNSHCPKIEECCHTKPRHFYIYHFIKRDMDKEYARDKAIGCTVPRNYRLRKNVKEQAMAINKMRRSMSRIKERVVGIDAASSEIGFRPEIFAQSFRYLKKYSCELSNHYLDGSSMGVLGCTYHVGEDFLDIADGLRAIDEAVRFLNLRRGDRLGHCLALGVDASEFYRKKNNSMILPKQDHLDNVMWLLMQIRKYNIQVSQALVLELQAQFCSLYLEIYGADNEDVALDVYYQSWLLRGDDPMLYADQYILKCPEKFIPATYWERCGLNNWSDEYALRHPGDEYSDARKSSKVRKLYKCYHFDSDAKEVGRDMCEYKVSKEYVRLIEVIQYKIQFDLAHRHLAIESNPTSNVLIGAYSHYADHPIKKFFNMGLTYDRETINSCPQLSVSLNTDDLGIFATNIENEYALMAIGMEKEMLDEKEGYHSRMIYDWLDRIRMMGFEQRFRK